MLWLAGLMGVMAVGATSMVDTSVEDVDNDTDLENYDGSEDQFASHASTNLLDQVDLSEASFENFGETHFHEPIVETFELTNAPLVQSFQTDLASIGAMPDAPSDAMFEGFADTFDLDALEQRLGADAGSDDAAFEAAAYRLQASEAGFMASDALVDELIDEMDQAIGTETPSVLDLYDIAAETGTEAMASGSNVIGGIFDGMSSFGANAVFGTSDNGIVFSDSNIISFDAAETAEISEKVYAHNGDIMIGGEGSDQMVMGDWLPEGAPVQMADFNGAEDELVLVWDNTSGGEPAINLAMNGEDPALIDVLLDDEIVAQVPAGSGLTVDQISLMPLQDATSVQWGWA